MMRIAKEVLVAVVVAVALTVGFVLSPSGCQGIRDFVEENPEVTKVVLRIALKSGARAIAENNPELGPLLSGLGGVFAAADGTEDPATLRAALDSLIAEGELEGAERMLVEELASEAVSFYRDVWDANGGNLEPSLAQVILAQMGRRISEGVAAANEPPDVEGVVDSVSVVVIETPAVGVVIE